MKLGKIFVLTGAFLVMTNSANAKLPGYTEGAEIMRPKIENGQIDSMSGIIYSQIKGLRSNRALRMTVMIPRDGKAKPAIIYFPGGGFTSADHEKFTEMRTALAKAGFVVAAAEYREPVFGRSGCRVSLRFVRPSQYRRRIPRRNSSCA